MSIAEFVSHLRNLDVRLNVENECIRLNAPKGVLTDRLRSQIAERKQELLEFLRVNERQDKFISPPIERRAVEGLTPLSFAQERLWFLEQLEPTTGVYNICRASRLTGKLKIVALEASLTEILRRHEALRSVIRVVEGRPLQVVRNEHQLKLSVVDLQNLANDEEAEVQLRIQQEALRPFDFSAGLFLRAILLRAAANEHVLILTTHHIMSDAWSMGILTRELWTLYEAFVRDGVSPLNDLPFQYSDFAGWQRECLKDYALESQLAYWKKQLDDIPMLNLPTDRPRLAQQSFRGARAPISLPESMTAAVNDLSFRSNVTPFMTLLATFLVLLCRYSGQADIVVGTPVANRRRSDLETLIGFFVNTLVIRADLSGVPAFRELLSRVREVCLGAYSHQDLPFEKLVHELKPERDQGRNPLFQVMFVLQNATRPISDIPGLRIEPIEFESFRSPFDLSLCLREREGRYIGYVEYSTDLFDPSTIERMIGHLQTLLQGIVAHPDQAIAILPLLTAAENHQLLVKWNDTKAEYPKDFCIHELFETQVERTPEAIAVQFEDKRLTYRELNSRANQAAHYLKRLGVGPENLVGICVERSLEMVIGLLGILKSGGAYVPLDPAYPRERLEFMLNDAHCSFLLTQQSTIKRPKMEDGILDPQIKVVCLDTDWEIIAGECEQNLRPEVRSDNLAYVIYTSGSAGMPKGVAIEHRNTVNLLQWAKTVYEENELAGVLASTSICFDLSVFELFVPMTCGGRVILADSALRLQNLGLKDQITLLNTVPSVMGQVLALGPLPQSIRVVNLAGEPLKPELVKQLYNEGNVEKVYDLYGPSETTTYSTFALRAKEGPTTIGRPVANTQVFILDSSWQFAPVGVEGELYIGGDGVARGYLNRPEFTSERFAPDAFGDDCGNRLYRTGDRARYRPDGNIEFLGRTDNQVKIRGYRIELGEIEAALKQHPAIKETVVMARDRDSSGEKDLIGYFVPKERSPVAVSSLRNYLREKLPDYMLPSVFVQLDALPLSPNGKIDLIELRLRDDTRRGPKETYVEPRTQVQELLIQIWEEELKIEAVGIHDNFFELGGHSLLAIQIISRVREAFDKDVPLSALFDTPTIAGLATTIEETISGTSDDLPPLTRAPRDGPLPLSMNQEHLWWLDRMIPATHFFNMPYVYRLSGDLRVSALENALRDIIRRHEALRTVFAEIGGRPSQIIKEVPEFELPFMDLRSGSADDVSKKAADLIQEERQLPFNLALGPLVRIKLLGLTNTDYLLLVTMHHIISDYWSMQVFRRELLVLYDAFAQGKGLSLAEPVIQFADYAVWERRQIEEKQLHAQLEYWKKNLAGPPPALCFTKHSICVKERSFGIAQYPIDINDSSFLGVKSLAARKNCTPFMIVLGVLSLTLYLHTDQEEIRIGTLVANRHSKELDHCIGHFLNTVIIRTTIRPSLTCDDLLKQVRDVTLAAYANQVVPYEQVARELEKYHKGKRESLFQCLLSYQKAEKQQELFGLKFDSFGRTVLRTLPEVRPTSLDLAVTIREESTGLSGSVQYKTDEVPKNEIQKIFESFTWVMKELPLACDSQSIGYFSDRAKRFGVA